MTQEGRRQIQKYGRKTRRRAINQTMRRRSADKNRRTEENRKRDNTNGIR